MRSVLNTADCQLLCQRVASLAESSLPRWGRMTVRTMLSHLRCSCCMALGELPVERHGKRAFEVFPLKHLILYVLPFPKGAPTAPELLAGDAAPVDAARADLQSLLERMSTGPATGTGPRHPLFGQLSRSEWGILMHKHVDHHLTQFGA